MSIVEYVLKRIILKILLMYRDEYSRVRVDEDDIEDIIDGSFQIKTPHISGSI